MRLVAPPVPIDTTKLDAVRGALRGWLIGVLAWFCEVFDLLPAPLQRSRWLRGGVARAKAQIARDLRRSVTLMRRMVFIIATARLPAAPRPRQLMLYPRDGRQRRLAPLIRRLTSPLNGANYGALRSRVAHLRALLDDLEPLIARVLKRMHKLLRAPRAPANVATHACDACISLVAVAPASANTS